MALGRGVFTSRAGQVAVGNSNNSYTFAGITSSASLAAQSGPLQVVTTDANGNLASDGGLIFDAIDQIGQGLEQANEGVALAFSSAWRPGSGIQLDMGFGMGLSSKKAGGRLGVTFGG